MAKRKHFEPSPCPEFEALRGESSQAELCRRHNLSEDQVSKWKAVLMRCLCLPPRISIQRGGGAYCAP